VPARPAPGPGLPGINPALINRPCAGGEAGAAPAQNAPLPNSVHRLNEEDQRLLREIKRADDELAEVGQSQVCQSGSEWQQRSREQFGERLETEFNHVAEFKHYPDQRLVSGGT
jgi:hypothetical protein